MIHHEENEKTYFTEEEMHGEGAEYEDRKRI